MCIFSSLIDYETCVCKNPVCISQHSKKKSSNWIKWMNVKVKVQQFISKWDATVAHFHHFFSSFSQKDVRSDPKAVQEVSAATTDLLENLGALAVEVYGAHTRAHTKKKSTKSALLFAVCFQSSVFRDPNFELWIKSMFTKNFLHVVPLLCPLLICDTCGGLSFFFFFSFNPDRT